MALHRMIFLLRLSVIALPVVCALHPSQATAKGEWENDCVDVLHYEGSSDQGLRNYCEESVFVAMWDKSKSRGQTLVIGPDQDAAFGTVGTHVFLGACSGGVTVRRDGKKGTFSFEKMDDVHCE